MRKRETCRFRWAIRPVTRQNVRGDFPPIKVLQQQHELIDEHGLSHWEWRDVPEEEEEKGPSIEDMAMLLRMLITEPSISANKKEKAQNYLEKHGLLGSICRDGGGK